MTPKMPVPAAEADEMLHLFETRHDLFQYQIEGWRVWPLFRFLTGLALQGFSGSVEPKGITRWEKMRLLAGSAWASSFPSKARYFCKTYASSRRETLGTKSVDVFFDYWLKESRETYFKVEAVNNPFFLARFKKALLPSRMTTLALDGEILKEEKKNHFPAELQDLAGKLRLAFSEIPALTQFSQARIAGRLRRFICAKRVYSRLLGRIKPEVVVVANIGEHDVIAAARERGIKTVELQHGSLYRFHYAYSWRANHSIFRSSMTVPDQIFVFGGFWREELLARGFWNDEIRVVGSPIMDVYRKAQRKKKKGGKFVLFFTSQGIEAEKVTAFFEDFLKKTSADNSIRLLIKLHPTYDKNDHCFEALSRYPGVEILKAFESPGTLEILALSADLHLSISSTCHYEALSLGVPTVILPFPGADEVMHLHHKKQAFFAASAEELAAFVRTRGENAGLEKILEYHDPCSLENMWKQLEK